MEMLQPYAKMIYRGSVDAINGKRVEVARLSENGKVATVRYNGESFLVWGKNLRYM